MSARNFSQNFYKVSEVGMVFAVSFILYFLIFFYRGGSFVFEFGGIDKYWQVGINNNQDLLLTRTFSSM